MDKITNLCVRDDLGEYGEFFVRESPVTQREGGGLNASATWACYSSFGNYAHHWSSMGEPFGEFIKGVREDYLLSKIARKEPCPDKLLESVLYSLNNSLERAKEKGQPTGVIRDAIREAKKLHSECDFDAALPMLFYESVKLSKVHIEWCDIETQVYPQQAVMFCRRLWPLFVQQFSKDTEPCNA